MYIAPSLLLISVVTECDMASWCVLLVSDTVSPWGQHYKVIVSMYRSGPTVQSEWQDIKSITWMSSWHHDLWRHCIVTAVMAAWGRHAVCC